MTKKTKGRDENKIKNAMAQVEAMQQHMARKVENSLKQHVYLPVYHLTTIFQLSLFEMNILLVCLAPELEIKYEKLYAYLQDDVTKKSPSVNLIMDLLCNTREARADARVCFLNQSPLLKYNLLEFIDGEESKDKPLISRQLKVDDRIVDYLQGFNVLDGTLGSLAKRTTPQKDWSDLLLEEDIKEGLRRLCGQLVNDNAADRERMILYLKGGYGAGKKLVAEACCREIQLPLIILDAAEL
ncbi:MAG: hypothetical protein GY765_08880, partial [bacterium]|nr:hypothetical protein [bacterium]